MSVTTPTRTQVLRPDWERPETWLPGLAHYAATTAPGDGEVLVVDASCGDLPVEVVYELLGEVLGRLTGGRPYGDVVIDADGARDALPPVPEPPEVVSRDAAEAMARARATKRIADVARAVLDRWRYETAPSPFDEDRPLVTVRIPTWNGRRLLVERTLPSVLAGEYRDLEILVCSDGPDPEARAAVEAIAARDPRVRYFELPERPVYPAAKLNLHRVGGIAAMNAANRAARGAFVCPLDHDDAFTVHHVSGLLHAAREARSDFVYGQALCEIDGGWAINGFPHFGEGLVSHGAVMWSSRLRHVLHDPDAWILDEAGDWNTWRRMVAAGATPAFLQSPVLLHFAERSSIGGVEPPEPTPEEQLADLHATGAGWLLRVAGVYGP